ncbi:3-carboxy-cis,cis-muconate cycloisomerase [Candidimonas sp. SYP-B2681]|uniref:3-carboxy-cis,cis-muconate cycloisomerase n=1 Tax=Candidimonas sp. SYP-B2681 TaxID=2497686 RepID=UPI000F86CA7F|nr:3-carboxy-cis,cis-muconate cycloisomerase [Candidimonas sp. SYP-B2681]RTZ48024.1 3-carboxy-cis,cis-muconate cycloisomerase [Candidimonas sp. SYP-B2681]
MANTPGELHRLTDLIQSTESMNGVWSVQATLQAILDVEAALARSCATHGVIPQEAVQPIEAACRAERFDAHTIRAGAALGGNIAIPLVKQLTAIVKTLNPDAAKYVHWGATSQDVIDTGTVLQLRSALNLLQPDLKRLCRALAEQARRYRDTPMAGRTWLQQALPITQGLKFAQCLDTLMRHTLRLEALRPRVEVLQFGGAAGTLASLGDKAPAVAATLANTLGLNLPDIPWHTQRDRVAEIAAWFGILIGSLGKVARDISLQMQTEVGELTEPLAPGQGGSSTMPHKRNPVKCAAILTASLRAPHLVSTILSGMVQEHERALGGWQSEWDALPELARLAGGALSNMADIISGIEVNEQHLRGSLDKTHGLILGEAIMLALGDKIGRLEAHSLVEEASRDAVKTGRTLRQVLSSDQRVTDHLPVDRLAALLEPQNYLGQSGPYVDAVLARWTSIQ